MTDSATRRAALALHGLVDDDRAWVWSHLTTSDRQKLGPFLDELSELGFPQEVSELMHADPSEDRPVRISTQVELIDAAAPKTVYRALRYEEVATLALVLDYHPWRWRHRVLRRLGRAKSRAIKEAIRQRKYANAEAVRHGVIESLAKVIASVTNVSSESNRYGLRGMSRW